jgi:integrase
MPRGVGLRFGELAALQKNRIDLDLGMVTVAESASVLAGGLRHVGPPKSDAGRRTVAIPPHIVPALSNTWNTIRRLGLKAWSLSGLRAVPCQQLTSVLTSGGQLSPRSA